MSNELHDGEEEEYYVDDEEEYVEYGAEDEDTTEDEEEEYHDGDEEEDTGEDEQEDDEDEESGDEDENSEHTPWRRHVIRNPMLVFNNANGNDIHLPFNIETLHLPSLNEEHKNYDTATVFDTLYGIYPRIHHNFGDINSKVLTLIVKHYSNDIHDWAGNHLVHKVRSLLLERRNVTLQWPPLDDDTLNRITEVLTRFVSEVAEYINSVFYYHLGVTPDEGMTLVYPHKLTKVYVNDLNYLSVVVKIRKLEAKGLGRFVNNKEFKKDLKILWERSRDTDMGYIDLAHTHRTSYLSIVSTLNKLSFSQLKFTRPITIDMMGSSPGIGPHMSSMAESNIFATVMGGDIHSRLDQYTIDQHMIRYVLLTKHNDSKIVEKLYDMMVDRRGLSRHKLSIISEATKTRILEVLREHIKVIKRVREMVLDAFIESADILDIDVYYAAHRRYIQIKYRYGIVDHDYDYTTQGINYKGIDHRLT